MYPGLGDQSGGYPGGYQGQQPGNYSSGYGQPGGPGGYAPGGAGGYGAPGGPGYVQPEIQQWFNAVDRDHSGKINSEELQAALVNGQGKNFSDNACKLMIGMFDTDHSGTIDVNEFQQLYNYVNQWIAVFRAYDRDQSGSIEEAELSQALQQMGFRFSPQFINFLINKSDAEHHTKITVDQFIVLCVQIQRFTEAFRQRDTEKSGMISISFEDFLTVALQCSS